MIVNEWDGSGRTDSVSATWRAVESRVKRESRGGDAGISAAAGHHSKHLACCFTFPCFAMFIINWFWDVLAQLGQSSAVPVPKPAVHVHQVFCTRTQKFSSSALTMPARQSVPSPPLSLSFPLTISRPDPSAHAEE
jgi:hypothetical protein